MMASHAFTVQPGVYRPPVKDQVWSSGICGCFEDMRICCCGFWCTCCLACKTSSDFGECLCLPLLDSVGGVIPAASMAMRSTMRERYNIQGDMCQDCLVVKYCYPCAWCQMAREVKFRKQLQTNVTTWRTINARIA